MLIFVYVNIQNKKMCKHSVKKLSFLIRFVSDRFKTQEICYKVIPENGGRLMFAPDCH